MPRMIFHAAYKLNRKAVSGSGIRPVKMYDAFLEAGYDVFDLTGTAKERKKKFAQLKQEIENGEHFDFLYSENATIPPILGDPNHFPHPFLERRIFAYLRGKSIPQSVFYRDIYWKFPQYVETVGKPIAAVMRRFYEQELRMYRKYMDIVYLPSVEMGAAMPILRNLPFRALPPGALLFESVVSTSPIKLLYIGGVGQYYKMHEFVKALASFPQAQLTICTPANAWEKVKHEYALPSNVYVVHKSGDELTKLYAEANIAAIVVEPGEYRDFAVPIKLFEYVGRGKPILATKGTLAGTYVEENGWGWSIPNRCEDIQAQLQKLSDSPQLIEAATDKVQADAPGHTWLARAQTVARDLTKA